MKTSMERILPSTGCTKCDEIRNMQHCSHAWALTVVRPNARTWETSVGCVKSRQGQATKWNTYSQSQQPSPHRCSHASKEKALMSHSHPRTPCKHSIDMLDRAPSDFPFHATTIPDQQPGGDLPLGDYCHASVEAIHKRPPTNTLPPPQGVITEIPAHVGGVFPRCASAQIRVLH